MSLLNVSALLITLAAIFSFVNYRWLRLPVSIGLMLISLLISLALLILGKLGLDETVVFARHTLKGVDFNLTLLQGMLSFLLFAGALHVNLQNLAKIKWVVLILATLGVVMSTAIVGIMTYYLLQWLGLDTPLIYCLLFGALISPTDPIAVMAILSSLGAPKLLEAKIAGESLFNDGVGVVIFIVLLGLATGAQGHHLDPAGVFLLFAEEVLGGIVFGLAIGWVAFRMLREVDNYQVEILITLALVMGGYALATAIHTSGPIAIVVAGLVIGNHGRELAMSEKTREHLDTFWELVDEILNAVLFVLIGLEVLVLTYKAGYLLAGLLAIPVVLLARTISVGLPMRLLKLRQQFAYGSTRILIWGGLRGGISVALALSLPEGEVSEMIMIITYIVVVFSILAQGLTIGPLIRHLQHNGGDL